MRAFLEMDAAIKTSARGFGLVLLTTIDVSGSTSFITQIDQTGAEQYVPGRARAELINTRDESIRNLSPGFNGAPDFFQRTGLIPGSAYQVLSVAENPKGGLMVLVRDWQRRSQDAALCTEQAPCILDHNRRAESENAKQFEMAAMLKPDDDSCIWLKYEDEVLQFFQWCHVCFDCRCYHDVRVIIPFKGSPVAAPLFFFRVRILPTTHGNPARLWIGLHQPLDESLEKYGLKLTLIVEDDVWREPDMTFEDVASIPCACGSYSILAESYGGVYESLPVVWMYMELRTHETLPVVFYILPHLRQADRGPLHNGYGAQGKGGVNEAFDTLDATVALLADDRESLAVELLHVPDGLDGELYRGRLDRLDWSSCKPVLLSSLRKPKSADDVKEGSSAAEVDINSSMECSSTHKESCCQLNGRWVGDFSW
ncbi:unnamed protein product [Phytomonas sp. EM1]|nr:unnamed protein product [Phytomonas sp. EM1]|eukprot:CCW59966.1 unnamed protein product [Phytomonas sp. isolate EM1]